MQNYTFQGVDNLCLPMSHICAMDRLKRGLSHICDMENTVLRVIFVTLLPCICTKRAESTVEIREIYEKYERKNTGRSGHDGADEQDVDKVRFVMDYFGELADIGSRC